MVVLAFSRQSCVNPVLLAFGIVSHIRVTQGRQFTGGVLRSISSRLSTVDHDVRCFIGQERGCELRHLVRGQIDRSRQMSMMIGSRWQSLDKYKRFSAINLQFQFVPRNCGYHEFSPRQVRLNLASSMSLDSERGQIIATTYHVQMFLAKREQSAVVS